jgi:hypothetical protein
LVKQGNGIFEIRNEIWKMEKKLEDCVHETSVAEIDETGTGRGRDWGRTKGRSAWRGNGIAERMDSKVGPEMIDFLWIARAHVKWIGSGGCVLDGLEWVYGEKFGCGELLGNW